MSFAMNDAGVQQLSLFDTFNALTEREKKFLDKSWAKHFAEHIFPKIDEKPYAVLYSDKDSRPNTPVNVQIGALILKEFTGLSDDDILTSLMFDIRFQYALHTTSFIEQPLNDRTLGRFRQRCATYEKETGIDLLHGTIESLADEMASMMRLDRSLRRMDSLMVASNIKRMGRLELLYTCVANLVCEMGKQGDRIPEVLRHYTEADDHNRVIYHNRSEETDGKINTVLRDARMLKELCGTGHEESRHYQLLLRVIREQAVEGGDGTLRLRTKEDGGMNAHILQNPADPEATFREKAGRQHRGYAANVTEISGEAGSMVMDYQYEVNAYSDSQFLKDAIEKMGRQEDEVTIITDGAYAGAGNEAMAEESRIVLVTTNLTGRAADDAMADFEFNDEGTRVQTCPGGHEPKSCSYNRKTGQCLASFHKSQCEGCPFKDRCQPKPFKRVCKKTVSVKAKRRAEQQRYRGSVEFQNFSRFRNGVETIPSILRRKYQVDAMPVRGYIRSKFVFGCKIGALNFKKFCKYLQGQHKHAQNTVLA